MADYGGWVQQHDENGTPTQAWLKPATGEQWVPQTDENGAVLGPTTPPEVEAGQRVARFFTSQTGDARDYLDGVADAYGKTVDWAPYAERAFKKHAPQDFAGWSWTDPVVVAYYILQEAKADQPWVDQVVPSRATLDQAGIRTEGARQYAEATEDAESQATALSGIAMLVTAMTAGAGAGLFGSAVQSAVNSLTGVTGAAIKGAVSSFISSGGDLRQTLQGAATGGATSAIFDAMPGGFDAGGTTVDPVTGDVFQNNPVMQGADIDPVTGDLYAGSPTDGQTTGGAINRNSLASVAPRTDAPIIVDGQEVTQYEGRMWAGDPSIDGPEVIRRLDVIGGGQGATAGAQALGYPSADAAIGSLAPGIASATALAAAAAFAAGSGGTTGGATSTGAGGDITDQTTSTTYDDPSAFGPQSGGATGTAGATAGKSVTDQLKDLTVKDWVGLAGVGVGAVSALSSLLDDSDEAYREAAKTALEDQTAIAKQMAGISQEQWNLYKTNVVPLLQDLSSMRTTTDRTAEDMAKAAAQTKGAYSTARQALERNVSATRNPGDPGYGALLAPSYMDEASAISRNIEAARVRERDRVENFGFDRTQKAAAAWTGQALPGAAQTGNANAGAINARVAAGNAGLATDASTRAAQGAYGGIRLATDAAKWFESTPGAPAPRSDPNFGASWRGSVDNPGVMDPMDPRTFEVYPNSYYGIGYRGGGAIRRRYAEGGKVEGPGSGTSDSIATVKRPGTYILSADTVRAIGTKKIEDLAEKAGIRKGYGGGGEAPEAGGIPVRLSSGEYALPPEVTQHYGEEFFNKLQQKYHRPIASEPGMANGGAVRRRVLPREVDDAIIGHYCNGGALKRGM